MRIFVVRHGESTANASGTIVSDPQNGCKDEYGLTERGREQAREAGSFDVFKAH
jgi:broad specificity phosphatase PhoE